jgi:predicted DNA-binding transcriptional regulator AlpA
LAKARDRFSRMTADARFQSKLVARPRLFRLYSEGMDQPVTKAAGVGAEAPAHDAAKLAEQILRMSAVRQRTSLGRSTNYRLLAAHQIPAAVLQTGRAIGWRLADIERGGTGG